MQQACRYAAAPCQRPVLLRYCFFPMTCSRQSPSCPVHRPHGSKMLVQHGDSSVSHPASLLAQGYQRPQEPRKQRLLGHSALGSSTSPFPHASASRQNVVAIQPPESSTRSPQAGSVAPAPLVYHLPGHPIFREARVFYCCPVESGDRYSLQFHGTRTTPALPSSSPQPRQSGER